MNPYAKNMKQGLLIFIGFCLGIGFIIAGVGFGFISFVTDRNIPPRTVIENCHIEYSPTSTNTAPQVAPTK